MTDIDHVLEPLSPADGEGPSWYIGAEDVRESFRRVLDEVDQGDALTLTAAIQYTDAHGGGGGGGGGAGLPASTPADDGKVLTVDNAGDPGWADLPPGLVPEPTPADHGLYLRVSRKGDIEWQDPDIGVVTQLGDTVQVGADADELRLAIGSSGPGTDLQVLQVDPATGAARWADLIWSGTDAEYQAIATPDPNVLYIILP
jgi:hypothetical protein